MSTLDAQLAAAEQELEKRFRPGSHPVILLVAASSPSSNASPTPASCGSCSALPSAATGCGSAANAAASLEQHAAAEARAGKTLDKLNGDLEKSARGVVASVREAEKALEDLLGDCRGSRRGPNRHGPPHQYPPHRQGPPQQHWPPQPAVAPRNGFGMTALAPGGAARRSRSRRTTATPDQVWIRPRTVTASATAPGGHQLGPDAGRVALLLWMAMRRPVPDMPGMPSGDASLGPGCRRWPDSALGPALNRFGRHRGSDVY